MRFLRAFLTVVVGVTIGLFLLNNNHLVPLITVPGRTAQVQLSVVILASVLAGAAPMGLLWLMQFVSGGLKIRALRRENKERQDFQRTVGDLESQERVSDPENLLAEVEAALAKSPGERRLLNLRTRLLLRLDRDKAIAEEEIPRLMVQESPDPGTAVLIADRMAEVGRKEEALAIHRRLLEVYPDADLVGGRMLAFAFDLGDVGLVADLMDRRGEFLTPAEKLAGEIYLLEKRADLKVDDRVRGLDRLIRRHPEEPAARIMLIRVLGQAGRYRELTGVVTKAYEELGYLASIREAVSWLVRGRVPHEAIALLRNLILTHPARYSLQLLLARLYLDLEMPTEAGETVEQIGEAVGDSPIGQMLAGRIALRRGETAKAARFFRAALDSYGHDAAFLCRECRSPREEWDLRCGVCGRFLTIGTAIGIALTGEDERYGYRHPEIAFQ